LLHWGIRNGAAALQMADIVGSLTPGTKPGILQITGLDGETKPTVKRIA
jgi:imidazolonepropionase-like amidohydrolase